MSDKAIIKLVKDRFADELLETKQTDQRRVTFYVNPEALYQIASYFYRDLRFRFIIGTGLHSENGIEIFYHFSDDSSGDIVNLHVTLHQEDPKVKSLTDLFSAAEWIEREIHEILGVKFEGHPNLIPLFSDGNWEQGVYPYRKKF